MTTNRVGALTLLLVLLVFSGSVSAKPKEKTFDAPRERVFAALIKVVAAHYIITFEDEKRFIVSFHSEASDSPARVECTATVDASAGKSTISINEQKTPGELFVR
jgi:hypothetical protein